VQAFENENMIALMPRCFLCQSRRLTLVWTFCFCAFEGSFSRDFPEDGAFA